MVLGSCLFPIFFSSSLLAQSYPKEKKSQPKPLTQSVYPHAMERIATVREMYDGALPTDMAVNTFRNIDRLFPSRRIAAGANVLPLPRDLQSFETLSFVDRGRRFTLDQYLELNKIAGLLILKDGKIKVEQYRYGNSEKTRWMSMSIAKSVTSMLFGAALKEGKIRSLDDLVSRYVPALREGAYKDVRVRDVLTMSSGVQWNEAYSDPRSDRRRLLEAQIAQKPGAAMAIMTSLSRVAAPGVRFNYNTGETQVAAEVLRHALGMPLSRYLSEKIWSKMGMEAEASWWLDAPDGVEVGGSGVSATLRDYGRLGLLMLNGGLVGKQVIFPAGWTYQASTPKTLANGETIGYGYLWWPLTSAQGMRDAAYAGVGIHGQYLYINPRKNLVIVVWGAQSKPTGGAVLNDQAFFAAVADALP
ncbi:MAG: serine hydrolase [Burkholderiales bacterium]|nr:serine hydrolase [Burkholderiales bacterium]